MRRAAGLVEAALHVEERVLAPDAGAHDLHELVEVDLPALVDVHLLPSISSRQEIQAQQWTECL